MSNSPSDATTGRTTKLLYTIPEVQAATSMGKTQLYEHMKRGKLRYVMSGDRRYVRAQDLHAFIDSLVAA